MSQPSERLYPSWSTARPSADRSRGTIGPHETAAGGAAGRDRVVDGIREILAAALIAVVAVSVCLEVSIGGRLALAEALLLLALPWLVVSLRPRLDRTAWMLVVAAAIWLSALVLTDVVRGTEFRDLIRGWARIGFLVVDFLALYWLLTTPRRFLVWLLAFSVGVGLKAVLVHQDPATQWKFGLSAGAFFASASVVLLASRSSGRAGAPVSAATLDLLGLLTVAATAVSLALNARSSALAFLLAGMLVLACRGKALRRTLGSLAARHVWVVALLAVAALYGVGRTYIAATQAGLLGEEARSRLQMQTLDAADPVIGLIGGGRGEFFASVRAIADSPVIGHGSWARSAEYYGIYVDSLRRMGSEHMAMLAEYVGRRDGHVLPTHSHVLGAWVEAGLAGAAFWLLVAVTLVRAGVRALPNPTVIGIVILCALPAQMWALAFSPLGADSRLLWALLLVGCCRILAADERPRPTGLFAQR
jgi:hypothetical protein